MDTTMLNDYTNESWSEDEIAELNAAKADAYEGKYGSYDKVVKKMRSFLSMSAEKTSSVSKELFREHIPVSVCGVSSDEVATDLGMSENELMADLMQGIENKSSGNRKMIFDSLPKVVLSKTERVIANNKKRIADLKSKFGCVFYGELRSLIFKENCFAY